MLGTLIHDHAHPEVLENLHAGAERLLEHLWLHDLRRRAVRDDSMVHAHQVWQVRCHAIEVMGSQHDRHAVFVQIGK
jgi:hypothetical protein